MVCLHLKKCKHLQHTSNNSFHRFLKKEGQIMSVCPSSEESNGFNFPVINKILGTSVKKSTFYTIQDDLLAYLAGSGVVVCKLNKEDGKITSQRFFCVNSNNSSMNSSPGVTSSANAYLNMIRKDGTINSDVSSPTSYEDTFRDSFGYPSDPIITGSSSESHTNTKDSDNLDVSIPVQSPSSSKFKDRVRSINCLSISPDKTVLAIGEIGYHPRIALFSLAPDLLSSPFALIYEHSFGINSISFSSDLKTFASLGLINDGFLNIWKIQSTSISLQASNKCTSVVNKMIWHENYIITLGLRMIKVWKSEKKSGSNNSVTGGSILKGKNVLLGSLINCNFISGDSLSSDEFLIMTESNILLLKLNYEALTLVPLDLPLQNFHSLCIDYDNEQVWFDSTTGLTSIPIGELKETKISSPSKPSSPTKLSLGSIFSQSPTLDGSNDLHKIINFNEKFLIFLSEEYEITLFNKFTRQTKVLIGSLIKNLSGIKASYLNEILVFSNEGVINKVELDSVSYVCKLDLLATEVIGNSLTAVDMKRKLESGNSDSDSDSDSDLVVCGDKFGTVYVSKLVEGKLESVYQVKAHTSTVNDVILFEKDKSSYICSISRDRMIQIFKKQNVSGQWDLLQTLPTHSGNILKVFYSKGKLYTCSSDRTISIHKIEEREGEGEEEKVYIIQEKVISLKNTPIAMKVYNNDLIISSNDKTLLIYNIEEKYEQTRSLKLLNGSESLLIENFVIHNNFIIVSSSDKSLRIFNYQLGRPIAVYWGHLDSIISLNLVSNFKELITISLDGCLFKWNLTQKQELSVERATSRTNSPVETEFVPLYTKVTRKIIPNVVASKLNSTPNLTPNSSRRGSIASPLREENDENSITSPSPVPRLLSAATLKRMESKKNGGELRDLPSPLKERSRSCSPKRNPLSPSKSASTIATFSPILRKRMLLDNLTNTLSHERNNVKDEFIDRSIAHLAMIKSGYSKVRVGENDKIKLRRALREIQDLIGDDEQQHNEENMLPTTTVPTPAVTSPAPENFDSILEKYSDALVALVQQKLTISQKNTD